MTWLAPHGGGPKCAVVFSDAATRFCLTTKVLFMLPWRQTNDIVSSLLKMAAFPARRAAFASDSFVR